MNNLKGTIIKKTHCEKCGSIENLESHHIRYNPEEVITLCRKCHRKLHSKKRNGEFKVSLFDKIIMFINYLKQNILSKFSKLKIKSGRYDDQISDNIVYLKPILTNKCVRWVITDNSVVDALEVKKGGELLWNKNDLLKVKFLSIVDKVIKIKKEGDIYEKNSNKY